MPRSQLYFLISFPSDVKSSPPVNFSMYMGCSKCISAVSKHIESLTCCQLECLSQCNELCTLGRGIPRENASPDYPVSEVTAVPARLAFLRSPFSVQQIAAAVCIPIVVRIFEGLVCQISPGPVHFRKDLLAVVGCRPFQQGQQGCWAKGDYRAKLDPISIQEQRLVMSHAGI